jgi:Ribosomal protein L7/L12 C-terminal domain
MDREELPNNVLAAIRAGRKIDAIKLLREQRKLGLKEAKEVVDAHTSGQAPRSTRRPTPGDSGIGRVLLVGLLAALVCAAYRFLS